MKIEAAKVEITSEWNKQRTSREQPTWSEKFTFYTWLETNRPDLLDFSCRGNKWQRVQGWLI